MVKNRIGSTGCSKIGDSGLGKTEVGNSACSHVAWPAVRWELTVHSCKVMSRDRLKILEGRWAAPHDDGNQPNILGTVPQGICESARVAGTPRQRRQMRLCCAAQRCVSPSAPRPLLPSTTSPPVLSFCFRTVLAAFSVSCLPCCVRRTQGKSRTRYSQMT